MSFCRRLANARVQRELTQHQLAERMGVMRLLISNWESDRHYPNLGSLKRLCGVLNVSADYLLGRTDEMEGLAGDDFSYNDKDLIESYVALDGKDRKLAVEILRVMARRHK